MRFMNSREAREPGASASAVSSLRDGRAREHTREGPGGQPGACAYQAVQHEVRFPPDQASALKLHSEDKTSDYHMHKEKETLWQFA